MILDWMQFNKQVSDKCADILRESNCHTYTQLGYKHLCHRLILDFYDCRQIYDFSNTEEGMKIEKFFTKDFEEGEMITSMNDFQRMFDRDKPE